jgi:hypothetical protein
MYRRLLVALDGSDTAARAFDAALTLAALAAGSGAELLRLHVIGARCPVLLIPTSANRAAAHQAVPACAEKELS